MRSHRRLLCWVAVLLLAAGPSFARGKAEPKIDDQLAFGLAMARRGLWNEALFRFRQANQARPNDGKILNNMAVAFEAVGRFEEALACYQKALQADPGNRELKKNYSRFLEFYQSYKPDQEPVGGPVEAAEDASTSAAGGAAGDAEQVLGGTATRGG